ncbi:hypothetical protein [Streptomyces cellulosae]|uniref:hypothetical protein n=1 Tax=Streptomyces cellulosae TaxID=1968 RepID=UPI000AD0DFAB|nr:hypothetical protein [Streptomyces cellulosae]
MAPSKQHLAQHAGARPEPDPAGHRHAHHQIAAHWGFKERAASHGRALLTGAAGVPAVAPPVRVGLDGSAQRA